MKRIAVIIAAPESAESPMASRIPAFLHPVAGRPLLWHTVMAVARSGPEAYEVLLLMPTEFASALPEDLPSNVRILPLDPSARELGERFERNEPRILVVRGSAHLDSTTVDRLRLESDHAWAGGSEQDMVAAVVGPEEARAMIAAGDLTYSDSPPAEWRRVGGAEVCFGIRRRADLARMQGIIRDRLVRRLMEGGVTFVIPESVVIDVEVGIGRDTIVYPGVVLEGQTTIGEETVIGPGCRIIDSWIGSGVELKGWNYISHASVRNRAILEPYVRRGFD